MATRKKPVARGRITPTIDFAAELRRIFDLTGDVALLPGGYGGLGEAIAWGLAMRGATVVIAGRDRVKAEKLAQTLRAAGHDAYGIKMDVNRISDIRNSIARVARRFGHIDILVNCVGIQIEESLAEVTEKAFDAVYRTNLKAAMFIAQSVAKHQIAGERGGRQIHLLSVRSQLGIRGRGYSAYCATKGGLVMLVKQHAMELAPYGITVNGIAPTFVYTDLIRHVMQNPKFHRALIERIPLGRLASPKDVVGPAIFFASPASGFVTGQIVYVDGGITASQ